MWLNQTIYPDYRLEFVADLRERLGDNLKLSGGLLGFHPGLSTSRSIDDHILILKNTYLLQKSILWQQGLSQAKTYRGVFVTEFNLRSVSTLILASKRSELKLPTVFWGHIEGRGKHILARWMRRKLLEKCSGFICYTQSQADTLLLEYPRLPIWVAPNATCRAVECRAASLAANRIVDLIYVGRLVAEKKPALLIRAFAHVCRKLSVPGETRLIFCGDGPERKKLEKLADVLGVSNRIVFVGHVSARRSLAKYYSTSLFSVSPGYVGLSATQSFSFGVPMIVARGEPHSPEIEACRENINCQFFDADDVKALSLAIILAFREKADWVSRRLQIAEEVSQKYTIERMVETFVHVDRRFQVAPIRKVPKRELRIALYWDYFQAYHCARLRSILSKQAERNAVVMPLSLFDTGRDFHKSEISEDVAPIVKSLALSARRTPVANINNVRGLLRALDSANPDVLFTPGYTSWATLFALRWAKYKSRPVVLMFETLEHDRRRWAAVERLKKVVVSHYSAAFTGGCQGREYLKKLGLPGDRIFLGYDAIDNNYFGSVADAVKPRDGDERAVLGLPLRYFLSVGRLIPKKGFLWMLEAYAQYVNSSEGQFIPLLIVGDGPDLIGLKSAVSRLGVDSLVQFRGYKTSAEIARYMALADLLIVPSVREEQWGLVINEAMAAGVPVLGTSICGATPELVIEGTTGFAVAPLDSRKLISLLKWATMHPDRLKEMGTAARRHVEKCSLDSFSDSFYKAALCAMERVNSD